MTRKERKKFEKKWGAWTEGSLIGRPSPMAQVMLGLLFVCLAIGGSRD